MMCTKLRFTHGLFTIYLTLQELVIKEEKDNEIGNESLTCNYTVEIVNRSRIKKFHTIDLGKGY